MTTRSASPTAPALPAELRIEPIGRPIDLDIAIPGSKSITNRYLVMGALADGDVSLSGMLHSDDTVHMIEGLRALGFEIQENWAERR